MIAHPAISLFDEDRCHDNLFGNAAVIQPAGAHPPFLPASPRCLSRDDVCHLMSLPEFFSSPAIS